MTEVQERVQRRIDELVATGAESGLQVAVFREGEPDRRRVAGRPTRPRAAGHLRTPIFSFSTGKNISATIAHLLVARGFLDYDSPVTDLWPEFGVQASQRRHCGTC